METPAPYDALLVVSFGGPEGPDDVLPFLENVLRGRNVPRERMLEVAEHYQHFGGVSPINGQVRELIAALEGEFQSAGIELPIYWGNRNWHPLLPDTLRQMQADGIQRALVFVTSAFSSYSGCRQYRENIQAAQAEVGPGAPSVDKLRMFYNHPAFIGVMAERTRAALEQLPKDVQSDALLLFTAHSIPLSMAENCAYVSQLEEAARLVAEEVSRGDDATTIDAPHAANETRPWRLVYQSRSGPPTQPWLEPDVCDFLREYKSSGGKSVVIIPLGFLSDHMEVLFDLDTEAADTCQEIGLPMQRAGTAGSHPAFVAMIRELVQDRLFNRTPQAIGNHPPSHDVCPVDCCI